MRAKIGRFEVGLVVGDGLHGGTYVELELDSLVFYAGAPTGKNGTENCNQNEGDDADDGNFENW